MMPCLCCGLPLPAEDALDLGELPVCNRFGEGPDTSRHGLQVTECRICHLVQLLAPAPPKRVVPRVDWIRYNEPAAHLPVIAPPLQTHLPAQPTILGIGPFDAPLLEVLTGRSQVVDLSAWLPPQPPDRFPYLESLQAIIKPEVMTACAAQFGQADLVVCRYLLEHSHQPVHFLQALSALLAKDGKLLIEVPDASHFLRRQDYSFLWEEHICYFTEASLRLLVARAGFAVEAMWRFPGAMEDAMAILLRPTPEHVANRPVYSAAGEISALFAGFRNGFAKQRQAWQRELAQWRDQGLRIGIFGAGHQAILFMHAHALTPLIDCVIDDAPSKLGQCIPGTTLAVVSSSVLSERQVDVCLLAVSPAAEASIRQRFGDLCRFHSIFRTDAEGALLS